MIPHKNRKLQSYYAGIICLLNWIKVNVQTSFKLNLWFAIAQIIKCELLIHIFKKQELKKINMHTNCGYFNSFKFGFYVYSALTTAFPIYHGLRTVTPQIPDDYVHV